jgi:hypothetical protein
LLPLEDRDDEPLLLETLGRDEELPLLRDTLGRDEEPLLREVSTRGALRSTRG